ncbi:hypothetical protein DSO57_1009552 [Entomophthora muscae]|uniref:Uncharacterized protein n=1 Tax=Entomophthora muscae TaxID=34485 RepID=A0ACC2S8L1_9FUNG|nr:hypothetical protein DSO57_1009552 [Entomophthora muscae]
MSFRLTWCALVSSTLVTCFIHAIQEPDPFIPSRLFPGSLPLTNCPRSNDLCLNRNGARFGKGRWACMVKFSSGNIFCFHKFGYKCYITDGKDKADC